MVWLFSAIVLLSWFLYVFSSSSEGFTFFSLRWFLIVFGYTLCWEPSNSLIHRLLKKNNLMLAKDVQKKNQTPGFNASAMIGTLERWLCLTFILLGHFDAIGFLVGAKSILRFNEVKDDANKSEYVLAGTLLSISIAILCGIAIRASLRILP